MNATKKSNCRNNCLLVSICRGRLSDEPLPSEVAACEAVHNVAYGELARIVVKAVGMSLGRRYDREQAAVAIAGLAVGADQMKALPPEFGALMDRAPEILAAHKEGLRQANLAVAQVDSED